MDNGAFELFKAGQPMYPSSKLIEMGKLVDCDYIVMTDYPGEPAAKTINSALELAPIFKKHGFGTFFVPQSSPGNLEEYIQSFAWAASSPLIDYIGISILGVPLAYGVKYSDKLHRYCSRYMMMAELYKRGLLDLAFLKKKKIHFLGLLDGPNEISLLAPYSKYIDTWDSSSAIWAGLNNIKYDQSPTGLINGKLESEVDFDFATDDPNLVDIAKENVNYINNLCRELLSRGEFYRAV